MVKTKRLILFGAGMTGRGQVAQLAYEDGWQFTMVDKDPLLVDHLRRAGEYSVQLLSKESREVVVQGFQALHTSETEAIDLAVSQADLVVTSVLEPNLPDVARLLAHALAARIEGGNKKSLNVIAAENMGDSTTRLYSYLWPLLPESLRPTVVDIIGFPNSMISRVVPIADDPLHIITEEYSEWTADLNARVGDPPPLKGLEWVINQSARLYRKLYIHNTGHLICGSLGWLSGHHFIHEAAQIPEIYQHVKQAIAESGSAVHAEYGFSLPEVTAYEEHLLNRLVISALADDIRRVIRHPIRKLGKDERLLGPLLLCEKYDLPRLELCYGIAAVLAGSYLPYGFHEYDNQAYKIKDALEKLGPIGALKNLVDYQPNISTAKLIVDAYDNLFSTYIIPINRHER